jgi:hypothetical protein
MLKQTFLPSKFVLLQELCGLQGEMMADRLSPECDDRLRLTLRIIVWNYDD